jgi:GH15 family glucan-1,4-alpha-glucosidase
VIQSVEVILDGQSKSGGYAASPTFPPYRYSWLRDGCFIADAMRIAGERESARRFHEWVARVVRARPDGPWDARYELDGSPDVSGWPKRQWDGLGLWLATVRRFGGGWEEETALVARWLREHWDEPCVDWWEEREGVHAATVWCIANGLDSEELRREALTLAERERVDGSHLFIGADELVARVEAELVSPGGGVHRHPDDVYYGGGEWLLLTAMLGQAYAARGRLDDAREKLEWVRAHARPEGLPEQSQDHLLHPAAWDEWVAKWGPPPSPLLWSHAMEIALAAEVEG